MEMNMQGKRKNIVILISGSGSNMLAIANAAQKEQWTQKINAGVTAVISNQPAADGLVVAARLGIATAVIDHRQYETRGAFDTALQRLGGC